MKFIYQFKDKNKTYEFEEYVHYESDIPTWVLFRDETWYCDAVSNGIATFSYVGNKGWGGTHVVGPDKPFTIKCDCGAESTHQPGHSGWCDILNKDPWDEAIRLYKETQEDIRSDSLMSSSIFDYWRMM